MSQDAQSALRFGYVWEKLHLAVLGMAQSTEPLADRVANAWMYHLLHLGNHELPANMRDDYARVRDSLRRVTPQGGESGVLASARALEEMEVRELVEAVVSMYDRAAKFGPNG
jgi:hypothetical protein